LRNKVEDLKENNNTVWEKLNEFKLSLSYQIRSKKLEEYKRTTLK